uniref:Odorant receptor n=1 Tax=Planotortrix octo TaxID=65038 RepID=A0A0B5GUW5_9NEOP|nr:olfactory receptor OR48 [Planotortrix octo]
MFREFLDRLRTEEMPLLGPNTWFLKTIGLRLPKSKIKKVFCVILHEIVTFFVITQYIELFSVTDDVDTMITNLKSSSLSIICVIKSNTMLLWQDKWLEAFEYVTEADKFERVTGNPARDKIVTRYTKQCSLVTYYYYLLLFFTNFGVISLNLFVNMTNVEFRAALNNGTVPFPHIFSAWTPYDRNTFPFTWITVVWHVFITTTGAVIISAYDTAAIVLMTFFGAKFELLRLRCAELFQEGEPVTEEEFDERVRQVHTLHTQLVKNIRLVDSLLSPIMCLYTVACSLVLCTSFYQLSFSTSISQKLMLAEYLAFGITQLFMYCWISNDVLEKSSKLMLGPYESQWWAGSPRQRRTVLMLAEQMEKAHVFSAGPFTNLTLPTFIMIVKGAYSYFTLLRN